MCRDTKTLGQGNGEGNLKVRSHTTKPIGPSSPLNPKPLNPETLNLKTRDPQPLNPAPLHPKHLHPLKPREFLSHLSDPKPSLLRYAETPRCVVNSQALLKPSIPTLKSEALGAREFRVEGLGVEGLGVQGLGLGFPQERSA